MTKREPTFVSFERDGDSYRASIAIDGFLSSDDDLGSLLAQASSLYGGHVSRMRVLVDLIESDRDRRRLVAARRVWQLGDLVFGLVEQLRQVSLQIDGMYDHLERDLRVKRKWLEKVVIFRRYIPQETMIPEHLNWGKCEKGTRRVAEMIRKGTLPGQTDGC